MGSLTTWGVASRARCTPWYVAAAPALQWEVPPQWCPLSRFHPLPCPEPGPWSPQVFPDQTRGAKDVVPNVRFDQLLVALLALVPRFKFVLPPYFVNNARSVPLPRPSSSQWPRIPMPVCPYLGQAGNRTRWGKAPGGVTSGAP